MPNCSGGLIQHVDGTLAGRTLDDDIDGMRRARLNATKTRCGLQEVVGPVV